MKRASSSLRPCMTLLILLALVACVKGALADILWQDSRTGNVAYWLTNGAAYRTSGNVYQGVPTEWQIVGTPDLNGDGNQDILWQNSRTGDVAYWIMNGTSYVSSGLIYQGVPTEWKIVGTPDIDGDGNQDILWQNTRTGDVAYWLMSGTQYLSSGLIYQGVPIEWKIVGTADLAGDGNQDILWQNSRTGDVAYWMMNGTSFVSSGVIYQGVPTEWKIVGTPSLNADGQTSLLWQNSRTGDVAYWLLNGTSFVSSALIYQGVPTEWKIVGTPDLAPIDLSVGNPAIPFRTSNMSGAVVNFPGDYHGKLVMLDFWASWCGPCRDEIPGLVAVYNKYHSRGFEVIGVSLDTTDQASLQSFLSANSMPWPQIYDGQGWSAAVAVFYNIQSIPQAFLIDGDTGQIVAEGNDLRGSALDGTVNNALNNMGHQR